MNNNMLPVGTTVHINLEDIKWECSGDDLISRSELIKALEPYRFAICGFEGVLFLINNAPTVCGNNPKWCESCVSKGKCASTKPQGEWVRKEDIMHYIATQYSEHNELVPVWLSIGWFMKDEE